MAKTPGSVWVDGQTFRFIDNSGNEYYYTGTSVGTPAGAIPGSVWVDGTDFHYIDASGTDRVIASVNLGSVSGATPGSVWVESTFWKWISSTSTARQGHTDVAPSHTDNTTSFVNTTINAAHTNTTINAAHTDNTTAFVNTTINPAHTDTTINSSHTDNTTAFVNTTINAAHTDNTTNPSHTNITAAHTDNTTNPSHTDNTTAFVNTTINPAHTDNTTNPSHTDILASHTDNTTNPAHTDSTINPSHTNIAASHTNISVAHTNSTISHTDTTINAAHTNSTINASHSDTYTTDPLNLYGWGSNFSGQVGDGSSTNRSSPVQIGSVTTWQKVFGGYANGYSIRSDGTLWAWGQNVIGQLGRGDNVGFSFSPIQVGTSTWTQLEQSPYADDGRVQIGIRTDGTLWGWGSDGGNGLLLGTGTNYAPVQLNSATNWAKISVAVDHAMGIKTDGTLWAWGTNTYGQLGTNNTTNYRSSPVQIGTGTDWADVSTIGGTGYAATVAIKTNGTMWSWGANGHVPDNLYYALLGYDTTYTYSCFICTNSSGPPNYTCNSGYYGTCSSFTNRSSPVQIGSATNWSKVSCHFNGTYAIKTDGTLWGWGYNSWYAVPAGPYFGVVSSPTQIGTDTWRKIIRGKIFGSATTMGIRTNGTLWAWGLNNSGEGGLGDQQVRSVPTQVGTQSTWYDVGILYATTHATR